MRTSQKIKQKRKDRFFLPFFIHQVACLPWSTNMLSHLWPYLANYSSLQQVWDHWLVFKYVIVLFLVCMQVKLWKIHIQLNNSRRWHDSLMGSVWNVRPMIATHVCISWILHWLSICHVKRISHIFRAWYDDISYSIGQKSINTSSEYTKHFVGKIKKHCLFNAAPAPPCDRVCQPALYEGAVQEQQQAVSTEEVRFTVC